MTQMKTKSGQQNQKRKQLAGFHSILISYFLLFYFFFVKDD